MNRTEYNKEQASLWEISDIGNLSGIEEGSYLEYKKPSEFIDKGVYKRDILINELTETVSAFLNSSGGVILVGVQTDKDTEDNRKETLKPLADWSQDQTFEYHDISLTESQIRDLIYGNIMPKPIGIDVKALNITINNNKATVFVISIPESPLGAHQATRQKKYYRRTSDADEPMLDYEIRNVNNRRAGPALSLACAVRDAYGNISEEGWKTSETVVHKVISPNKQVYNVYVFFSTMNLGRGTANIAKFDIGIPDGWAVNIYSPTGIDYGANWVPNNETALLIGKRVSVFILPELCHSVSLKRRKRPFEVKVRWQAVIYNGNQSPAYPIWPTAGRRGIGDLEIFHEYDPNIGTDFWLPWRIATEGMPETRGVVLLRHTDDFVRVDNYEIDEASWWGEVEDDQTFEDLKQKYQIS